LLASPPVEKILHGADYDLRGLHRDWGLTAANIFDTYVAARIAGIEQVGLSALASSLLGLDLPKEARIQKQDWSKRPLTQTALDYAAADVAHLAELRDALAQRLAALGRQAWADEEFARLEQVRHQPPDPDRALFSFKEGRGLDARGLAVLRSLLEMREAEARRLSRPPAFVVPNAALGELAANPALDPADAPSMPPSVARRLGEKLRRAVKRGLAAPEVRRPAPELPPRPRPSRAEAARIAQRLKRFRPWRAGEAARLAIDPALVWPARSLERLSRDPQTLADELQTADVRRWQQREFSPSLARALEAA
ncbi:MAG: HRDC domain-containing protein, partial [Chloroflexota bacterium]|nr:HRDC domain-containing protein [Chloroflexota bacterium]